VDVRKYADPKDLATFLKTLASDRSRYEGYLGWKTTGKIDNPTLVTKVRSDETGESKHCKVCDKLAEVSGVSGLGPGRRSIQVDPDTFGSCSPEASPIR
jgi:hypothetical protein